MEKKKKTTVKKKNSKAVQALQKNEKQYTYLFVGVFLLLFLYFGYQLFFVPDSIFAKLQKTSTTIAVEPIEEVVDLNMVSTSSELVTLTEDNILSDDEGEQSTPYIIRVKNNADNAIPYRIFLKEDLVMKNRCGCEDNYFSHIRYRVDQNTRSFEDGSNLVIEGELESKEEKEIFVYLWFEENLSSEKDIHFHGHFILES
jgi:hypothetical protein